MSFDEKLVNFVYERKINNATEIVNGEMLYTLINGFTDKNEVMTSFGLLKAITPVEEIHQQIRKIENNLKIQQMNLQKNYMKEVEKTMKNIANESEEERLFGDNN